MIWKCMAQQVFQVVCKTDVSIRCPLRFPNETFAPELISHLYSTCKCEDKRFGAEWKFPESREELQLKWKRALSSKASILDKFNFANVRSFTLQHEAKGRKINAHEAVTIHDDKFNLHYIKASTLIFISIFSYIDEPFWRTLERKKKRESSFATTLANWVENILKLSKPHST